MKPVIPSEIDLLALNILRGKYKGEIKIDVNCLSIAMKDGDNWNRIAFKTILGDWRANNDVLVNGKQIPFYPNNEL